MRTEYWARVRTLGLVEREFEVTADSLTGLELQLIALPIRVLSRGLREAPERDKEGHGEEAAGEAKQEPQA